MTMLELVKDEELFGQLITCLECRNDERLKSLLSDKFSDVTSLANSFSSWLDDQINSYLTVDASSRSSTNTNSKNCTNSIDNAVSQARVSKGINNSALESRLHDQRSIANESTANKNDSTVSQDKVTNTPEEANGHCCNNNFPLTLGGYPIQVKIKKKKRLKANLVSQPSNKIFEGNISTLPDTDDLFESKASRTAKEVRIDPARRLASLDTRAAVASTEIEVGMKSVNEGSSAAIHKVDTLTISESSRTAQLLLILLHLHYISLAKYLEVLAKLINCAKILLDDQASFEVNTVFSNSSIRQFVVALLTLDIGVLKSLGRFVVQEISQSLIVQKQLPQILEQLNSFLDDIDQVDAPSIMPEILPETFLKPFNDQFDNRSDYKNQVWTSS